MTLHSRPAEHEDSLPSYRAASARWKKRARQLIGSVPVSVPEEHRRAYVLTLAGYLFMVAAQASIFLIFLAASEFEIAVIAAAGVAGFGICLVAHLRGHYRAPPYVAMLIVVVEGFVGSLFRGGERISALHSRRHYLSVAGTIHRPTAQTDLYGTWNPCLCGAMGSGHSSWPGTPAWLAVVIGPCGRECGRHRGHAHRTGRYL
jgi:hypothetical protein